MKRILITLSLFLTLVFSAPGLWAQQGRKGNGAGKGGRGSGGVASPGRSTGNQALARGGQSTVVSAESIPALLRMWEEEKLARDVYLSLGKTSKLTIFQNIARAEIQHMRAIERLVGSSNLPRDETGIFSVPEYAKLYSVLVASGSRSPLDALLVGAKVEEMDIADLKVLLAKTTNSQIRQVLEHLMRGSENHLRAFASQIAKAGATYRAEFLSQSEFDQIANSKPGNAAIGSQRSRGNSAQSGTQSGGNAGAQSGGKAGTGAGGRKRRGAGS